MEIQRVTSGAPWEKKVGYCRLHRRGPFIFVAGTLGLEADGSLAPDAERQARRAFEIIGGALVQAGADFGHVVATRMYVVNMAANQEAVGRMHAEFLGSTLPAGTMVGVPDLALPNALVEVELQAILAGG